MTVMDVQIAKVLKVDIDACDLIHLSKIHDLKRLHSSVVAAEKEKGVLETEGDMRVLNYDLSWLIFSPGRVIIQMDNMPECRLHPDTSKYDFALNIFSEIEWVNEFLDEAVGKDCELLIIDVDWEAPYRTQLEVVNG